MRRQGGLEELEKILACVCVTAGCVRHISFLSHDGHLGMQPNAEQPADDAGERVDDEAMDGQVRALRLLHPAVHNASHTFTSPMLCTLIVSQS